MVWSHSGRHDLETIRDTAALPALARFKAEAGARMQAYRQADGYHQSLVALLNVGRKRPA